MLKARPQNLTLLLLLAIMVAATAVLLLVIGLLESKVAIGIFGVLVGSAISAATSIALAKANARFALRTAALEKRLKAHQEGYALWHEILERVHRKEKIAPVVIRADRWWKDNCLYLDAASRRSFRECLAAASNHRELVEGPRSKETAKLVQESWAIIMKPKTTLVEGVALPSLGEGEDLQFDADA